MNPVLDSTEVNGESKDFRVSERDSGTEKGVDLIYYCQNVKRGCPSDVGKDKVYMDVTKDLLGDTVAGEDKWSTGVTVNYIDGSGGFFKDCEGVITIDLEDFVT